MVSTLGRNGEDPKQAKTRLENEELIIAALYQSYSLGKTGVGFEELLEDVRKSKPKLSRSTLSSRLDRLEEDGFVNHEEVDPAPITLLFKAKQDGRSTLYKRLQRTPYPASLPVIRLTPELKTEVGEYLRRRFDLPLEDPEKIERLISKKQRAAMWNFIRKRLKSSKYKPQPAYSLSSDFLRILATRRQIRIDTNKHLEAYRLRKRRPTVH